MASPQKENGYTPISNEIMDALARSRIAGVARQVLDVVFRNSYGWSRCHADLSLDDITTATGLSKVAASKAIRYLTDTNIITKNGNITNIGNERVVRYCIQKNYEEWKLLPKKVMLPKKVKPITKKGKPSLLYKTNEKQYILSALLFELIQDHDPDRRKPDFQKWAKHVDLLIKRDKRDPGEIERVIRWCQRDEFWHTNILSTESLRAKYDKLVVKMRSQYGRSKYRGGAAQAGEEAGRTPTEQF